MFLKILQYMLGIVFIMVICRFIEIDIPLCIVACRDAASPNFLT